MSAFSHQTRRGEVYYLQSGPKRGGGTQYYFSRKQTGTAATALPDGFEIYETVDGQVYLRRKRPKLILDCELDRVGSELAKLGPKWMFRAEVDGEQIVIHESR